MAAQKVNNKFIYECIDCGKQFFTNEVIYLCASCAQENSENQPPKGVLKVIYNYSEVLKNHKTFNNLKKNTFIDIIPLKSASSYPKLNVGNTPLYQFNKINNKELPFQLYLKDDSQNPSFSFKDRASALVSAFAKENNINTIVAASTGNAGSSLAGICASQGQKAIVMVPESAPIAKLTQIIMYGATIIPVKGTYDQAFDLSIKATEQFGWYNRNTAFNPLTIEGKKTVSFEIFDQLNETLPDRIFVPVGDGVIISGVYKGFEDLLKLNLIDKIPTIIAVQAEGSNNIIRNLDSDLFSTKVSKTIADSISVDIPRNFYMTKQFISKYKGEYLSVTDDEILQASVTLSRNTGIFAEPAASAAFAGFLSYYRSNQLDNNSKNVVLLTGSGLKDLTAVKSILKMPESIEPTIENLKKSIG